MATPSEEMRFYMNLLKNNLFGHKYDLFKIPSPPGYRFSGHIPYVMRPDYHRQCLQWSEKYGPICRFSLGGQHVVVVTDPALASQLLGRGQGGLPRKTIGYQYFDLATNHLGLRSFFTTVNEDQWQLVRKGTAQAFSSSMIKRYFTCALKHAQELVDHVRNDSKKDSSSVVDIQEHLEMMLLDVFLEGLFEMDLRRVNSEEIGHAMNLVLEEANERIKSPLRKIVINMIYPLWARKIHRSQRILGNLYERIYNTIRSRGTPPEEETVLWACLARLKDPQTDKLLSKEQLLPEIGAFILAGFDTSSHTIAWCLFTIATHQDVQRRVKEELVTHGLLHKGKPNCHQPRQLCYEDLAKLTYLNCVIDETMRMFPVAATGSVRETVRPTKVGDYMIPEGIVVWPMIYAIQNSSRNWEAPHEFLPERWLEKNQAYDPKSGSKRFLPFSDGIKSCLGQALGLMEVRTALATLCSRFWFELSPSMGTPEQVENHLQQIALTLKIKGGLKLICKPHLELHDHPWVKPQAAKSVKQH